MANRKRDAGREAQAKKGWWKSHRWLVLRRLSQFLILAMFLSGPWLGVWILHGNYSSSLLLDSIPFTDPLITLQSLASGHLPATVALMGAVIITVLYAWRVATVLQLGLSHEPCHRFSQLVAQKV